MVPRPRRFLAAALAVAFAVVSYVTCVGAEMTVSQKACCAAMNHNCGGAKAERECCGSKTSNQTGLLSATPVFHLLAPSVASIDLAVTEPLVGAHFDTSHAFEAGSPKASRSPTFLLVSVFRL